MTEKALQILCGIPVAIVPIWPALIEYSTYEKMPCAECQEPIWIGIRGKALIDQGEARPVCPRCAMIVYGVRAGDPIEKLTDRDKNS